jgi:hypothetical protein
LPASTVGAATLKSVSSFESSSSPSPAITWAVDQVDVSLGCHGRTKNNEGYPCLLFLREQEVCVVFRLFALSFLASVVERPEGLAPGQIGRCMH